MSRIAIVGSGIAGLTCAYKLSKQHEVTLFEANNYAGGHTATIDVQVEGKDYAVDTGFIVFNDRTYPRFQRLLAELEVDYQPTQMSFSVQNPTDKLIYNGHTLNTLFCQRKNILSPRFWGFVRQILRFNANCKALYADPDALEGKTLGEYLSEEKFSEFFAQNYILPMGAAIWSSSLADIQKMPLKFFVQFFYNHGLLDIKNRPQWYTIIGGSRSYVQALLRASQPRLHLSTPVQQIRRDGDQVIVVSSRGEETFDEVILACHSDQALAMLAEPTADEQRVLGAIPYRSNEVLLHTDPDMLPPMQSAHASWNYHCDSANDAPAAVTYSMNILQRFPEGTPTFNVTLNNSDAVNDQHVLRRFNYSHPVFSEAMVDAQSKRSLICGVDKIHFCGAYWYNGFHEDGVHSAEDICERFA